MLICDFFFFSRQGKEWGKQIESRQTENITQNIILKIETKPLKVLGISKDHMICGWGGGMQVV